MKLVCLMLLFNLARTKDEEDDGGKIFGGRDAYRGEFPFAVAIIGAVICGGSAVSMKSVVTAAHCLAKYKVIGKPVPRDMNHTVVIGGVVDHRDRKNVGYQERNIDRYVIHHDFKKRLDGSLFHDIGIIEVVRPFIQTETLAPLPLVSTNQKAFKKAWNRVVSKNATCLSMGWGTTRYKPFERGQIPEMPSNVLKVFEFRPIKDKECKMYSRPQDNVTMYGEVCGFALKYREGFCSGDSGSPFICDGYVYGFTTASYNCHDNRLPQTFLLFWYYLDYFNFEQQFLSSSCPILSSSILIIFTQIQ